MVYTKIIGMQMGNNYAPLVTDSFLVFHERDFMLSLSDNYQADVVEEFKSLSRCLVSN